MGIVRESPPFTHAKGMKGGKRVVKRWESSEKAHLRPCKGYEGWEKGGQKVGIGWTKHGRSQAIPTFHPYKRQEK
ncbi:hypothetical protein CYL18_05540 [Pradoshia eiseniae]|uniref:Uncharacterized protein n=1 Tax=Pradoshia eiseniae TaxID=2064768 RepID=A0A2S7N207_9BACI|nr:hypothetical protein CYL18_05540 [Pradoshia eiseniae]